MIKSRAGFVCGAGGSRTRVQTGKPYAFYTFIPDCGFRAAARPGPPTDALSSKISSVNRGIDRLFPIYLHRLILRFGTTSLERCLVPSSDDGIKPVIYCTSIRQRERSCFRQLICDRLVKEQAIETPRAYVPLLLLSNPVNPRTCSSLCHLLGGNGMQI